MCSIKAPPTTVINKTTSSRLQPELAGTDEKLELEKWTREIEAPTGNPQARDAFQAIFKSGEERRPHSASDFIRHCN